MSNRELVIGDVVTVKRFESHGVRVDEVWIAGNVAGISENYLSVKFRKPHFGVEFQIVDKRRRNEMWRG